LKNFVITILAMLLGSATAWCQISMDPVVPDVQIVPGPSTDNTELHIAQGVRHELLMLNYYTIFDDLGFTVRGTHVTLTGAVTNDDLAKWAVAAAKRVEGVEQVTNKIEGLPPLTQDRPIRFEAVRRLSNGGLAHYINSSSPWIHVVVRGGYIRLVGYVSSESDKKLATVVVSQVPEVFGVKNELQVVSSKGVTPSKK